MHTYPIASGMVDTHFHSLEMTKKGQNVQEELSSAFTGGLAAAVDIGISIENFSLRKELTRNFPNVFHAIGLSPAEAEKNGRMDDLLILNDLAANGSIVAVGEIGLDYHWDYATRGDQLELLRLQLDIASDSNLPVIIHNRDSDEDMLKVLTESKHQEGGIIHCYSSDAKTARRFIDIGYFISFAGNITYKNAAGIKDAAKTIPLSSILIETDSPYLSPVPERGKVNSPIKVSYVYDFLSELRGISIGELIEQVLINSNRALRLQIQEPPGNI